MPTVAGDSHHASSCRACGSANRERFEGIDLAALEAAAAEFSTKEFAPKGTLPNLSPSQTLVPVHYDTHLSFLFPLPAVRVSVTVTLQDSRGPTTDATGCAHLPANAVLTNASTSTSKVTLNGVNFLDLAIVPTAIPAAAAVGAPTGATEFNPADGASSTEERPVSFEYANDNIVVTWSAPFAPGAIRAVTMSYVIFSPASGLTFGPIVQSAVDAPAAADAAAAVANASLKEHKDLADKLRAVVSSRASLASFITSSSLPYGPANEDKEWLPVSWVGSDHESERCRYWLPCVDQTMVVRSRFDFYLTVWEGMDAFANGIKMGEWVSATAEEEDTTTAVPDQSPTPEPPASAIYEASYSGSEASKRMAELAYPPVSAPNRLEACLKWAEGLISARRVTTHYRLSFPTPPYLLALGAGYLVRHRVGHYVRSADKGLLTSAPTVVAAAAQAQSKAGLNDQMGDVVYFGVPTVNADGATAGKLARSFRHTTQMLHWIQARLGVPFPFPKYYQWVSHATPGAMENVSLVTWTEHMMQNRKSALERQTFTSIVNIHEMAHSYFGDAVTSRHFDHAWLKESWATYMEYVWLRAHIGVEEMLYMMKCDRDMYFNESANSYVRPVSTNVYKHSWKMFDGHLYPGGAWRLHTLCNLLGSGVFWEGVRGYLQKHMSVGDDETYRLDEEGRPANAAEDGAETGSYVGPAAETDDFRSALERAAAAAAVKTSGVGAGTGAKGLVARAAPTHQELPHYRVGTNLVGFFQEFIYGYGFPLVTAKYSFSSSSVSIATVSLEQTQDFETTGTRTGRAFDITVPVAFEVAPEQWEVAAARFDVATGRASVSVVCKDGRPPLQVLVDPQHTVLMKLTFTPPLEMLQRTVECIPDYPALYRAAALAKERSDQRAARAARRAAAATAATAAVGSAAATFPTVAPLPEIAIPFTNGVTRAWAYNTMLQEYPTQSESRARPVRKGTQADAKNGEFVAGEWVYDRVQASAVDTVITQLFADPTPSVKAAVAPAIAKHVSTTVGNGDVTALPADLSSLPAVAAAIAAGAAPVSATTLLLALATKALSRAENVEDVPDLDMDYDGSDDDEAADKEEESKGVAEGHKAPLATPRRWHGGLEHSAAVAGALGSCKGAGVSEGIKALLLRGREVSPGESDGDVTVVEDAAPAADETPLPARAHAPLTDAAVEAAVAALPAKSSPQYPAAAAALATRLPYRMHAALLRALAAQGDVGAIYSVLMPAIATPGFQGQVQRAAIESLAEVLASPALAALGANDVLPESAGAAAGKSVADVVNDVVSALEKAYDAPVVPRPFRDVDSRAPLEEDGDAVNSCVVYGSVTTTAFRVSAATALASAYGKINALKNRGDALPALRTRVAAKVLSLLRARRADVGATVAIARVAARALAADDAEVAAAVQTILARISPQDQLGVSAALAAGKLAAEKEQTQAEKGAEAAKAVAAVAIAAEKKIQTDAAEKAKADAAAAAEAEAKKERREERSRRRGVAGMLDYALVAATAAAAAAGVAAVVGLAVARRGRSL